MFYVQSGLKKYQDILSSTVSAKVLSHPTIHIKLSYIQGLSYKFVHQSRFDVI